MRIGVVYWLEGIGDVTVQHSMTDDLTWSIFQIWLSAQCAIFFWHQSVWLMICPLSSRSGVSEFVLVSQEKISHDISMVIIHSARHWHLSQVLPIACRSWSTDVSLSVQPVLDCGPPVSLFDCWPSVWPRWKFSLHFHSYSDWRPSRTARSSTNKYTHEQIHGQTNTWKKHRVLSCVQPHDWITWQIKASCLKASNWHLLAPKQLIL